MQQKRAQSGRTGRVVVMEILIIIVSVIASAGAAAAPWLFARYRQMANRVRALEEKIEDVSDRNWELRDAAERARSLVQAQGDLIVRRNASGAVTYANEAFCALADPYAKIVGENFALPVVEEREPILLSDGTRIRDQRIASAEGERWISWREVIVRDPRTDRAETQSVGRDVTARMETERALAEARDQAEAASRAKSRFLAAMSHEIRTPLNGILGMADLLSDTPLTAEQRTYAAAVKNSGLTLLSLIEDVLDFSRIEAGKLTLMSRPFALGPLVEEMVELMATRAQAKNLEIGAYIDDRLPQRFVGDAGRLRQVLLNLAGNAVKFTERGGVCISVLPAAEDGGITFRIRDTGIGIPLDAQERIFAEFEQAQALARRPGGTGLGLSISQRIVQHMGGQIRVESRPGEGACFHFTIPLSAEPGAPPIGAQAPELNGRQVLMVSGSVAAPLIAQQLEAWGARTGLEPDMAAATLFAAQPWDAIIADRTLGLESLRALAAAARPHTKRIVLLAPGERKDLPIMNAFGFGLYLIKPVRSASLAAVLGTSAPELHAAERPLSEAAEAAPKATPSLKILVAEDNEINALLARSLLEKLGHRAAFARDGAQAFDLWRQAYTSPAPFDLVLMDVQMPVLDGVEAAKRIRAAEGAIGASRRVPIVALSADTFAENGEACFAGGMDDFLIKPLDRDKLSACLAQHSGGARVAA